MAASAYAALGSLSQVLEQIQHPARHQLCVDRSQIVTLHEMVRLMLNYFNDHSTAVYDTAEVELLRAMANCITEAEDVIDSHVVDQLSQRSADKADMGYSSFCENIEREIQTFKILKEEFAELREAKRSNQEQQPSVSLPAAGSSAPSAPTGKNTVVGIDDHMARIKDRLTGGESALQIVPIVGMGGIGKTTLAQNIFYDPCFKKHFGIRIWFTISQAYSVPDILVGLLGERDKKSSSQNKAELGQKLYKKLFGRKYLIVLDDVWSTNVWDDLKLYFPDTSKGSRIIITTRSSSISDSLGHENSYVVDLLDGEKSWELLCKKVFEKGDCPDPELEKIGRRIASNCKGLPLAIVVIGGLLSKSNVTMEKWEEVARNVNSIVNSKVDELCLNILSLSYNHLPIQLKPCFLYMRVYPEDYDIKVSTLVQSWIAEGFVISKGGKTLEEVAEHYLKDLVDRNLILTNNQYMFGHSMKMIKMCGIHDLLRDLCLREYQKENTFHIAKLYLCETMQEPLFYHRGQEKTVCHLCNDRYASKGIRFQNRIGDSSDAHFLVCKICETRCPGRNTLRLVDIIRRKMYDIIPLPTKMRYLEIRLKWYHFNSTWFHLFWNLRSIIYDSPRDGAIKLPSEIWKMPQLRHVKFYEAILPEPPGTPVDNRNSIIPEDFGPEMDFSVDFSCREENPELVKFDQDASTEPPGTPVDGRDSIILENLETLGTLVNFSCSDEILARIPNLKKLKIFGSERAWDFSYNKLHNLIHLQLEKLTINWRGFSVRMTKKLPLSLKKLTLEDCLLPWEKMTIIGSMPNLEEIKLKCAAFVGKSWNPVEGEFLKLKKLAIHKNEDLANWNAEKEHFPKLEFLLLDRMRSLEEIPPAIGDIETLLKIVVAHCPANIVDSAKEIVKEQETYGNVGLQLHLFEDEDFV